MSNSPLVVYTKLSPNCNTPRKYKIDTITIHHMAGNGTIEAVGNMFANPSRQGSSNYGVGSDGRIGLYVDEANRAWTSSSPENDHRAITIEVANDTNAPNWTVSDKALKSLILLCADICKRNGIKRLLWQNDKNLIGQAEKQNMTKHNWFAATTCPGPYLESKFGYIADEVNKILKVEEEKVTYDEWKKYYKQYETEQESLKPDSWAVEPQKWCKDNGISDGTYPKRYITRQEVWAMFKRLYDFILKKGV